MDRRTSSRALRRGSMPPLWTGKVQLLLSARTYQRYGFTTPKTRRRDLYCSSTLWFKEYYRCITGCGISHQSQENPEYYEGLRRSWHSAWPPHFKATSRTYKVSISPQRDFDSEAIPGLEHRYHLYTSAKWLRISMRSYGLVQSFCPFKPTVKYSRWLFLRRRIRRGHRSVRKTRYFQYRSGRSIQLKSICRGCFKPRNQVQYGWTWKSFGQCIYREAMEVAKV